jgi:hypothetical protein
MEAELAEGEPLTAEIAEPPEDERRGAVRHQVSMEAQCMLIALVRSDPWLVLIKDVSCSGIGFEFAYPLPPGAYIALELPRLARRDSPQLARAQVMGAREQEDGTYLIGCRLAKRLEPEEVERFAH